MAAPKNETAPEQDIPTDFELTLDEFCMRLSSTDGRIELIGGFHHDEIRNKRIKDKHSTFMERFTAFASRPVKG
jgi:hypothetical protein